jgi:DNA polymerase I
MARIDPAEVRARYGVDPFRILSLRAAILQTSCRAHRELAQLVLQHCCKDTARLKPRSLPAAFPHRLRTCGFTRSIATMNKKTPLPSLRSQKPPWRKAAALAREWELNQLAGCLEELGPCGSDGERETGRV